MHGAAGVKLHWLWVQEEDHPAAQLSEHKVHSAVQHLCFRRPLLDYAAVLEVSVARYCAILWLLFYHMSKSKP